MGGGVGNGERGSERQGGGRSGGLGKLMMGVGGRFAFWCNLEFRLEGLVVMDVPLAELSSLMFREGQHELTFAS